LEMVWAMSGKSKSRLLLSFVILSGAKDL
jgi:hypothetical protein